MPNGKLSEDFIPASTYSKSTEEQEKQQNCTMDEIWRHLKQGLNPLICHRGT